MTLAPIGAATPAPATKAVAAQRPSFAGLVESRTAMQRAATAPPSASGAVAVLATIDRAQARVDAVLAAARAGRTFTAAELIGLQAEAYRCAQTVDLASKLAEQGAQSVKQALNSQI